jgi:hypothetical protein
MEQWNVRVEFNGTESELNLRLAPEQGFESDMCQLLYTYEHKYLPGNTWKPSPTQWGDGLLSTSLMVLLPVDILLGPAINLLLRQQ